MSASRLFNLDLSFIHNFSVPSIVNANAGAATIEVITGGGNRTRSPYLAETSARRRRGTLTPPPQPATTHKHTQVLEMWLFLVATVVVVASLSCVAAATRCPASAPALRAGRASTATRPAHLGSTARDAR